MKHSHFPIQCDNCGKEFSNKWDLVLHEQGHRFECDLCNKTFVSRSNVRRHIRTVHENQRNYQCPDCHQTFTQNCNFDETFEECPWKSKRLPMWKLWRSFFKPTKLSVSRNCTAPDAFIMPKLFRNVGQSSIRYKLSCKIYAWWMKLFLPKATPIKIDIFFNRMIHLRE